MIEWINNNATIITLISTIILVIITGIYVFLTKKILDISIKQSKLSYNPVIGIDIEKMFISEMFGESRRNLSIDLKLANVGNAPAIEVLVDAEITFNYSNVNGEKTIPARFEPDVITFIRPTEEIKDNINCSPNFGNTCITHLFDDFRESHRLNIHRIETDPSVEPFNASKLKIIIYYRNSVGQFYVSIYETHLHLGKNPNSDFPKDDETSELTRILVPRAKFHVSPIDKEKMEKEMNFRNSKRHLSGW